MTKTVLFFSSLWVFCFSLLLFKSLWITDKDLKDYKKQHKYLNEKKTAQPLTQERTNIVKELHSENFNGKIFARKSSWIFQPSEHVLKEEYFDFTAEITQDNLTKTICSKNGCFDFYHYNLILSDCKTCAPMILDDGTKIMVTSFSKNACFHLDPKELKFTLEKTHTNIKR